MARKAHFRLHWQRSDLVTLHGFVLEFAAREHPDYAEMEHDEVTR